MANDVDDAEMVSFFDFNVLLVVIIRKDEIGLSFIQEVNVVDFICFFENVMVMVNLHCIKFFNGPGNERLWPLLEELKLSILFVKNDRWNLIIKFNRKIFKKLV